MPTVDYVESLFVNECAVGEFDLTRNVLASEKQVCHFAPLKHSKQLPVDT